MSWTISDIAKLKAEGKIKDYKIVSEVKKDPALKVSKPEAVGIQFIKQVLTANNIPYTTEYKFHDVRRFRFDIALSPLKIAIEYEGLVTTGKKGGHQTKAGYTSNCDKYNLAASMGWRVYRYTFKNYKQFESDLKSMFNN